MLNIPLLSALKPFDGPKSAVPVEYIIIGMAAGLCVAAVYLFIVRRLNGSFVKALMENECIGEENAKSFEQLGIKKPSSYIKKQLGENGGMSKMIKTTQEGKIYIDEEHALFVQKKYPADNTSLLGLLGIIAVILIAGAAAVVFVPSIIDSVGELF